MAYILVVVAHCRFDEDMIESLFGYNLQNQMKNDEGKNKTPSPSKHVLEPKRLQNFTILSKALNVTAEQVCGALIRGTKQKQYVYSSHNLLIHVLIVASITGLIEYIILVDEY